MPALQTNGAVRSSIFAQTHTCLTPALLVEKGCSEADAQLERLDREAFVDFLLGVLDMDPATRWTPRQVCEILLRMPCSPIRCMYFDKFSISLLQCISAILTTVNLQACHTLRRYFSSCGFVGAGTAAPVHQHDGPLHGAVPAAAGPAPAGLRGDAAAAGGRVPHDGQLGGRAAVAGRDRHAG